MSIGLAVAVCVAGTAAVGVLVGVSVTVGCTAVGVLLAVTVCVAGGKDGTTVFGTRDGTVVAAAVVATVGAAATRCTGCGAQFARPRLNMSSAPAFRSLMPERMCTLLFRIRGSIKRKSPSARGFVCRRP